jgi:hypothetical protein
MLTRRICGRSVLVAFLLGCAGAAGARRGTAASVRLAFARPITAPGDTLSATLFNGSDTTLGFNACQRVLERREAVARWDRVYLLPYEPAAPVPPGGRTVAVVCATSVRSVAPGAQAVIYVAVPPGLRGGTYRFRFLDVPADPHAGRAGPPLLSPEFTLP